MRPYLDLLADVRGNGEIRQTRNAVTRSLFTKTLQFDMRMGFPLPTTKKMPFKSIVGEQLTFLQGSSSNSDMIDNGCYVWTANTHDPRWQANAACRHPDDMGRIYGVQWRHWRTHTPILNDPGAEAGPYTIDGWQEVDQIAQLLKGLREDPYGRRHVVSAWNPGELDEMCLPPCHMFFQCYATEQYLDLTMYQRSCDLFLGVPFNIASYALLLQILAGMTGREPRRLTLVLGDVHIYEDHMPAVEQQLMRQPSIKRPWVQITPPAPLHEIRDPAVLEPKDFSLHNYDPHPKIEAEMIV